MQVSLKLRSGQLALALRATAANSRRLPSYLANRACNAISYRAWQKMPKVDPASIIQELEVSRQGVTATGRLSRAKRPRRVAIGSHPSSLASRIVLASFYGHSPFNIKTGQVFARMKPDTHGSAEFWGWIAGVAARMTKARLSSAGFFAACARAVNVGFGMALGRFSPRYAPRSGALAAVQQPGTDVNKASKLLAKGLAQVYPADGESGLARFSIAGTEPDTKGNQGALERVAGVVWQEAVDAEAQAIREHIAETYKGALRETGFKVR